MTEFEINKKVAQKLGLEFKCSKSLGYITVCGTPFDPCNNVEQAWEIMMKYNICVTRGDDGLYDAFYSLYCEGETSFYYCDYKSHKKPLVSAMLCYLEINK